MSMRRFECLFEKRNSFQAVKCRFDQEDSTSSLVNVAKESREICARSQRAFTCKRTFGASTRIMASESSPDDLERTTKNTDEEDLENELLDGTATKNSDSLLSAVQSLNKIVADMVSSFADISSAIAVLKTLPAKGDSSEVRLVHRQ